MTTYIVSRHPGAVLWVQRRLGLEHSFAILPHVSEDMRFKPGDHVCGVLPISLAARICMQGATPHVIDIQLPPEARGRELTAADMDRFGAALVTYHVKETGRRT